MFRSDLYRQNGTAFYARPQQSHGQSRYKQTQRGKSGRAFREKMHCEFSLRIPNKHQRPSLWAMRTIARALSHVTRDRTYPRSQRCRSKLDTKIRKCATIGRTAASGIARRRRCQRVGIAQSSDNCMGISFEFLHTGTVGRLHGVC